MWSIRLFTPLFAAVSLVIVGCGQVADDDVQFDASTGGFDAPVGCAADSDNDGVCDPDDVCAGSDDTVDADNDGVPDGCDVCAGFDDGNDADVDTVPDGCDACPANDDTLDADTDGVPDGCDVCEGFDDAVDADTDGVPDGCDRCPGFDDNVDTNNNGIPDACEPTCDPNTEVESNGVCYYLDGSGGACNQGYVLAPQSILNTIATQFVGKTYKNQMSDNCCIWHANQAAEGQDWGMPAECNTPGPFTQGPQLGAVGCTDVMNQNPAQLTLCRTQ